MAPKPKAEAVAKSKALPAKAKASSKSPLLAAAKGVVGGENVLPLAKAAAPQATASSKSPLFAAAKGVVGGEKVLPPAKAAAPAASAAKTPPPVVNDSAPATYKGKALDIKSAQALFVAMSPADMESLSRSSIADEQLPARMLLELVGDKDLTWANAAKSLMDGTTFKNEVLEMEGATYVTRKSIERFEALGTLQPNDLQAKNPAAFAIAVYVEAIIWAAKEKLGMNDALALPTEDEKPPEWPIMVGIKDIPAALADARKWQRTALFLCCGKAATVDTFFSYQSCNLIDAKWILNKVDVKKELSVPQVRQQLRNNLVSALKFGQPIHISMANSAVAIKSKYCTASDFPEALFKNELWFQQAVYSKIIRESDLVDWPGAFPGKMKDRESYSFVTSDFNLESAQEFLPSVLPHFADMAIIQVDPTTINA